MGEQSIAVGIEAMSFFTSRYYVAMRDLATARGLDEDHYRQSLGQEKMAVSPPGEDAVTLAANAAAQVLARTGKENIEFLVFGTETGVDQAKSGGLYVHGLLGLPARCRCLEFKQACYGATGGLQLAAALIRQRPQARALIIGTDIAKYGLGTAGEPTQGACAVAMVVAAEPQMLALDPVAGFYAEDVMDFWRPNYRKEALVDGKLSVRVYTKALLASWEHFQEQTGRELSEFARFCYHMPFTRMAEIAHRKLLKAEGLLTPENLTLVHDSQVYNRQVGNSYTASVHLGLQSALANCREELTGKALALFSYGSGCQAEFYAGVVQPGYRNGLEPNVKHLLDGRHRVDLSQYEEFYRFGAPEDGSDFDFPTEYRTGAFRLAALRRHKPIYESV